MTRTRPLYDIGRAIAAYETEDPDFHPFSSKYDYYVLGQTQLTPQELNGLALFNNPSKGNCTACHPSQVQQFNSHALFTDFSFDNIGVPRNWAIPANHVGAVSPIDGSPFSTVLQPVNVPADAEYAYYDLGVCGPFKPAKADVKAHPDLTTITSLCGVFKVPTLRNIAITDPYFHNGVFATLHDLVEWYVTRDINNNTGNNPFAVAAGAGGNPYRAVGTFYTAADGTPDLYQYNDLPTAYDANVNVGEVPYVLPNFAGGPAPTLTAQDIDDVVAFLCTLTDGFDPNNPSAYIVPDQCAATRVGLSPGHPFRDPARSQVRTNPMKQSKSLRAAILLACAVGGSGGLAAAETAPTKKTRQQQQIDALAQQLQAVQEQLKELAAQNKALLESQAQLQKEVDADHKAVVAAQSAPPGAAPAAPVVASGLAPAGNGMAPATGGMSPTAGGPGQRPTTAAAVPPPPGPGGADPIPVVGSGGTTLPGGIRLWGYGEVYYTRPSRVPARSQADLARAVFGIGYKIDDKTEFNSEFEVEHAVSSADDVGEFEVEQFYLDRQINDAMTLRAGLFLMPFGLLNEYHEPTYFYGVQRNFVETLIIPSTWREGGLNLHGNTPIGLSWNAGVTTGIDLAKWDFAPEVPAYSTALDLEGSDVAPLQASHQELALANAHNFSQYLALGYYGIPGVTLGAAAMTGKANPVPGTIGDQRVTLWEGHARWTPGDLDLSALYAHGAISNTGASNAVNPGTPNPIPSNFYGYYLQAAYDVWQHGDYRLAPFTRWERYDMASRYAGLSGSPIPTGLVPLSSTRGIMGIGRKITIACGRSALISTRPRT